MHNLIAKMSYSELADTVSYASLVKFERAFIASLCKDEFNDSFTLDRMIDLAVELYKRDDYDHSKFWYIDLLAILVNEKGCTPTSLELMNPYDLLDKLYALEEN